MAISVTCQNCGKTLQAKDEWAGKNVRCPGCKEVLTVPSLKAKGPPPAPVKAPAKRPPDEEMEEDDRPVSKRRRDDDDDDDLPVKKRKKSAASRGGDDGLKEFSPIGLLLISLVCGLVPAVWLPMLHGKLPKERDNDPSFATALILMLVPILNFYGLFFVPRRLALRLNEEREKVGLEPDLADPLVSLILYFVCPPVGAIMFLIWLMQMQTKVNEIVQAQAA